MHITKAMLENFEEVKQITRNTISEIYPHYYPKGAVDFFLTHHRDENIRNDILSELVYLLTDNNEAIGTVTIKENEICRLFVLPKHQHKGAGSILLTFAEELIAESYPEICIDSSLPAKNLYLKRGYAVTEAHTILTENGDVLCYDRMVKTAPVKIKN